MRFFFATVGLHNPSLAINLPEHMAYPVSQHVQGGLDLDYTALLLGQEFIIDTTAYDQITQGHRTFLQPMAQTLVKLRQHELLTIVDLGKIISRNKNKIMEKVDFLLENPLVWLNDLRNQWKIVKTEFQEFQDNFGSSHRSQQNTGHFGVENWLAEIGESNNNTLRTRIMEIIESKRSRLNQQECEFIRGSMKFIITQVLCTDLLRHELGVPFLNWDDSQPYYDRFYATSWNDNDKESAIVQQSRILFNFVIPELKPNNIDEVIRFIRANRAVESMRSELFKRVETGEDVSKEWFAQYLNQAFRKELVTKDRIRKFRWLGSAFGIILPGASLVQEIVEQVGLSIAESRIGNIGSSFRWYYALQKAAMRRN